MNTQKEEIQIWFNKHKNEIFYALVFAIIAGFPITYIFEELKGSDSTPQHSFFPKSNIEVYFDVDELNDSSNVSTVSTVNNKLFGQPNHLDIKIRNIGQEIIILRKIDIEIIEVNRFSSLPMYRLNPSGNYTVRLSIRDKVPYTKSVKLSHAIPPNEADRFLIAFFSDWPAIYYMNVNLYYNDNIKITSEKLRLVVIA